MPISTVAEIVRTHGRERPEEPAIHFAGRTVTFGELDVRSSQLANALATCGVGARDRVAFLDKNGLEFWEVTFALAKLNAVNVAVNWRLARAEIAQVVGDARAKVLIVGQEFVPHIETIETELESVSTIVTIDCSERWDDYEALVASGEPSDPGVAARADDVAFQFYTSGTTGLPKGVMLSNDNSFKGLMNCAESWRFSRDSVNLAVMPMFHISGTGPAMVGLFHGCQTILLRDLEPARILELIPEFGVTNALFVPAVIQLLLLTPGVTDTDFSSLRAIVYAGSPITDTTLTQAMEIFGCDFIQLYGLTETTGPITQFDAEYHNPVNAPALLRSCGKPYPWVEMRIVDPETRRDVADGTVGELWTRSLQNMLGYWDNDEATRAAITDDGWFRTGDAGYRDEDGFLFLQDRVKDMIVSGGENIYPAEVENILARHRDVIDVAVIGVPDAKWGEAVKAVVVRREGSSVAEPDLIAFARGYLAGYKLPKSVDFIDALPRNPSGKLLKKDIRAPYWQGAERQIG